MLAPVVAPVHPPQPLAVEQMSACEMDDDPVALQALDCLAVERLGRVAVAQHRFQQCAGVSVAQPGDRKLGKPRQLPVCAGLTHREDDGHQLRQEAAGDERECLRGSTV